MDATSKTMDPSTATVGEFKKGSITEIRLSNFMTHGSSVIQPGPRLNIVVGANGTGKSSILSAICLGLGGSPKLLSRSDDLRSFVKHGENVASITVTLAPGDHTFRRTIDVRKGSERGRGRGASTFYINDRKSSVEEVNSLVKGEYDIQIDNLCTFLPQENVGNFSGLKDAERLLEAEKTLPNNLHEAHLEITELQGSLHTHQADLSALQEKLDKSKRALDRLEVDRGREKERLEAASQLELLKGKRIWLQFEVLRERAKELKGKRSHLRAELKKAEESLGPHRDEHQEIASRAKKVEISSTKLEAKVKQAMKDMTDQFRKYDSHDDSFSEAMANLVEVDSEREHDVEAHKLAVERLENLEECMATSQSSGDVFEAYETAKQNARASVKDFQESRRDYTRLERGFAQLEAEASSLKERLDHMADESSRRRDKILRQDANLKKIYSFIKENANMFQKPVYGPIAAEVTPTSRMAADQLEQHVGNNIWRSFVAQTVSDRQLLYRELREKQRIPINVICVENLAVESQRMYREDDFGRLKSEFGIVGYLDELYAAPDPIRIVLEKFGRVNKVLVGNDRTMDAIDNRGLRDHLHSLSNKGSCLMATKNGTSYRYTQIVSSYGDRNVSSREDQVGPARMLAAGVDEEQKQRAQTEWEEKCSEIDRQRPELDSMKKKMERAETLSQELQFAANGAKKSMEDVKKLKSKVERQRKKVDEAANVIAVDNTQEKKKSAAGNIMKHFEWMVKAMSTHGEHQDKMMEATTENAVVRLQGTGLTNKERILREELQEMEDKLRGQREESLKVEALAKAAIVDTKRLATKAAEVAPLIDAQGNDLPLKSQLEELQVGTVDDCDAAIEEAERCLQRYAANPEVVRQYDELKAEIDVIEERVANSDTDKANMDHHIENKLQSYESYLKTYVAKISDKFATYMKEMGFTGEVQLDKPGDDNRNCKEWGLQILVSFRENTKAQVLRADRHSGGERAVSTIMFLMALQDLMVVPFRSVDEINQGLDDRNERLVFRRIVQNSTSPPSPNDYQDHTGQYFLITPKLLPNLHDMENEAVTILFVFNGPYNFAKPTDWSGFIAGKRKIRDNEPIGGYDEENVENRISKKRRSS